MSLDRSRSSELDAPVGSAADLAAFLRGGEKPREAWRVGTEHEKLGLHLDTLRPVAFEGERGIAALLERVADEDGWERVREGPHLVALAKGRASITLEPGGQLELSGEPLASLHETCREFRSHLELMKRLSEPMGIVWLALGAAPLHTLEEMPRIPKERYRIMRAYLPARGELALEMMHTTATVQANLDYSDEADMVGKLRTALSVTPIVSALFANSSLSDGKPNGFVSKRLHIWSHTDPDRTGLLPFAFEPDMGYARYVEWALDVPLFFVLRDGRYLPGRGKTFRRFLAEGHEGERATLADFERHLTTLFPEVRLKRVLELRGADAVPPELTCSLPAIWKGILYDEGAREAAAALVEGWGHAERRAALEAVARRGLAAEVAGRKILELAGELVEIAAGGLRRIAREGGIRDERSFLDPLRRVVEEGRSPGQVILDCWEGEWRRSPRRLIEYARY